MRGLCAWILVVGLVTFGHAETLVTKAKIAEINERGFVLTVGTEAIPAQDESTTHFWKDGKPTDRSSFAVGDSVTVRLKTDATPTLVRELADNATSDWLEKIRKGVVSGTIAKVDPRYVTVKVDGGGQFAYRYSAKSKLHISGASSISELKEGEHVYIRGRLLPSLDTWITELSDQAIKVETKATKTTKATSEERVKPLKINSSGTLKGTIDILKPPFQIIDVIIEGRLLHITYNSKTVFKLDGQKADASACERGLNIEFTYRRDQFGRLILSKVEVTH
jgi:hypothetical protein